eukprot:g51866.t1
MRFVANENNQKSQHHEKVDFFFFGFHFYSTLDRLLRYNLGGTERQGTYQTTVPAALSANIYPKKTAESLENLVADSSRSKLADLQPIPWRRAPECVPQTNHNTRRSALVAT